MEDPIELINTVVKFNQALLNVVAIFDVLIQELKEYTFNYHNLEAEQRSRKMTHIRELIARMEIVLNVESNS
jgi:vancomycin permeability regulator SanA